MASYLTQDQKAPGKGTKHPGATHAVWLWGSGCPSLGLCTTIKNERDSRKGNNRVQPEYPLILLLWVDILLVFHPLSPEAAPSPQPHSTQGLLSGDPEAPLGPGEQSR